MRSRGDVLAASWLATVLICGIAAVRPVDSRAEQEERGVDDAAVARALEVVRTDPQLAPEKTVKTLRWRQGPDRSRPGGLGWLGWIAGLFTWLGQSARVAVWVAVGVLAVLLARYVLTRVGRPRPADADEPFVAPTHVRDLDIRPASLPPDIGAAARALWDAGERRPALALLYRGLLSRLAHVHGAPIHDATTEGDCLALTAQLLSQAPRDYTARLVRLWQRAVYGHDEIGSAAVYELCDGFADAMDRRLPMLNGTEQSA